MCFTITPQILNWVFRCHFWRASLLNNGIPYCANAKEHLGFLLELLQDKLTEAAFPKDGIWIGVKCGSVSRFSASWPLFWPCELASQGLRPWKSPGKNTRSGCHFLLFVGSSTQGSNLDLHIAGRFTFWATGASQRVCWSPKFGTCS